MTLSARAHRRDRVTPPCLEAELLAHLDTQIDSARRLLALVLAQGAAIRARDVDAVLAQLADIQTEMGAAARLEQDRAALLQRAGAALGIAPPPSRSSALCALMTPGRGRSSPASAPPSCAACSPRSPASTASTAR